MFVLGSISIGTLTAFISYATQMFDPISNIARIFAEAQQSQAAAERVISLIETEPEIADTPEVQETFGDNFNPKRENWPKLVGDIAFQNVSFQYSGGEKVLKNFNLNVKGGRDNRPGRRDRLGQIHHRQPPMPFLRAHRGGDIDRRREL